MKRDKDYWLGFSAFPGIGPLRFQLLLKYFGSAKKAWEASENDLLKIGLGEKLTAKFVSFRKELSLALYKDKLSQKNIKTITLQDKIYPELLREIVTAPFVLYCRGNLGNIKNIKRTIAVVGTRKITNYGREATRQIVQGLVLAGFTIVSGMAYGVDTVAHMVAIEQGGKTIAVLGCGVDIIHPKSNTNLYWEIVEKAGVVVSEFPPGRYAERGFFPARNRIISGLSLGVVVTEGAYDSGSLITARFAVEQGREVFAVPGPITSKYSEAPTKLLKQGAKLVTKADDIFEEFNIKSNCSKELGKVNKISEIDMTKDEKKIYKLLESEDLHFDDIVRKSRISARSVGSILTMMEMKGIIKDVGSGVYVLKT